jgi:hypothetical protein
MLCLADVQHTFDLPELAQIFLCNVVLALPLLEGNEINAFSGDELLDFAKLRPRSSAPPWLRLRPTRYIGTT